MRGVRLPRGTCLYLFAREGELPMNAKQPCSACALLARQLASPPYSMWGRVELYDAIRQHERETGHKIDTERTAS